MSMVVQSLPSPYGVASKFAQSAPRLLSISGIQCSAVAEVSWKVVDRDVRAAPVRHHDVTNQGNGSAMGEEVAGRDGGLA